jgi:hypothetical protein
LGYRLKTSLRLATSKAAIVKPTLERLEAVAQLYKTTEEILEIQPRNGKQFFLSEVQDLMGQGVIGTLRIDENLRMLYFEDALPRRMAFNGNASIKAHMTGTLSEDLHGNVIFADVSELFWGEQFKTTRWRDRR